MFCSVTKNTNSKFELLIQIFFSVFLISAPLTDQPSWALCLVFPWSEFDNAGGKFSKLPRNVTIEFLRYFGTTDFVEPFRIC